MATIRYEQGPQVIKSEDTFLVGYVLFDKLDGFAEVDVVENAQALIQQKIDSGELKFQKELVINLLEPMKINYEQKKPYQLLFR